MFKTVVVCRYTTWEGIMKISAPPPSGKSDWGLRWFQCSKPDSTEIRRVCVPCLHVTIIRRGGKRPPACVITHVHRLPIGPRVPRGWRAGVVRSYGG
ncbi:hypothetical protein AVEN_13458-1 [Araneus ventricosus]|uniref:Uncharacterized protein n=1 Tax=Araneus ventricosus TaxID=182803 RepID=A0A4Y2PTT4_ARAVE|nr:hypothetical protein AVEN_13458-1 [Araneus ventricosus]